MQSEIANPEMQEGSQTDFASGQVPNPGDFSVWFNYHWYKE